MECCHLDCYRKNPPYTSDTINSNPRNNGATSIGVSQLDIDTFFGTIHLGQVFNVPNDTKMYTCLSDTVSGGTIQVVPNIRVPIQNDAILNFIDPSLTVIMDSNASTITHTENGLIATATLNWTESL